MKSLFVKIFLGFWLTIAVVVLVNMIITFAHGPDRPRVRMFSGPHSIFAQTMVEKYEKDGQSALVTYVDQIERESGIKAYLFDDKGKELAGGEISPDIQRALDNPERRGPERPFGPLIDQTIRSSKGNIYTYISRPAPPQDQPFRLPFQNRSWDMLPFAPRVTPLQLVLVLLIAGVACYAFARYLTAPVVRLRAATQQFAGGDLTARVGFDKRSRGDELVLLGRDFDMMAERIEALMMSQRRLLNDISHELRSPLARLNLALELAREGERDEVDWALGRIDLEAGRLSEMISQLLLLARMEGGGTITAPEKINLVTLVSEITADADFEARRRSCHVEFKTPDKPVTVSGNSTLLRSAIENVIRNGVRHTSEGSVVEVTLHSDEDHQTVIRVRDHGTGVPESALDNIFQPFYRVADARDRESGGVGLGLAITERSVKMHGGNVKAMNAADGGLIVEIRLPGE